MAVRCYAVPGQVEDKRTRCKMTFILSAHRKGRAENMHSVVLSVWVCGCFSLISSIMLGWKQSGVCITKSVDN